MRPKFAFALSLLAVVVLGGAVLLKEHLRYVPPPVPEKVSSASAPASNPTRTDPVPVLIPVSAAPVVAPVMTPEQHQEAIGAEIDRLQQWSMNNDPTSLSNIVADLTSPDKEIRDAAIEAIKELGDTNAIPTLKGIADNTEDLEEKISLLQAADFLSLPSMNFDSSAGTPLTPDQIQAAQQQRATMQAQRQARLQNHGGPGHYQSSQPGPSAPN